MGVAGQDRVDPLDAPQGNRGVFGAVNVVRCTDAGMGKRDDEVGTLFLDFRHPGGGGRDDVARGDIAFKVMAVPLHDLWRHKADQADADVVLFSRAVGDLAVKDDVGLEQKLVLTRRGTLHFNHIGGNNGELRPGDGLFKERQAVVEFVVAQRRCLNPQHVHRLDCGVDRVAVHALFIGHVIAHRVALQKIAVVDQHGVGRFGADTRDQGRGAGEANGINGFVGVIIIGVDIHMDISGFHDAQMGLIDSSACRKGVKRYQGCSCGGLRQKAPAGEIRGAAVGHSIPQG
ncbi:hypothetical protein GALL_502160 [mine drainage metagenome]|uniref:Uncharacterized protein n=1 Tax=mine drainage metagenome TaxID=410659 RepID=A0A1J5PSC3_9ZZZZ